MSHDNPPHEHERPPVAPGSAPESARARRARKRHLLPAIAVAVLLGVSACGNDGGDDKGATTKVAAATARPTVTVTATATETVTAEPEPAPTVTATKTVKVKVTVTAHAASGSGSGGSGNSGGSGGGTSVSTCSITSNAGNCYSAGQYCRNSDHGAGTTTAGGTRITCAYRSGGWRWTYS
ncbi:hypothetical protein ACFVU0_33420 [Streptomyces sp. NPDC058122]|uniref:hypothetical protein n=1 Tax=Streptomyces sp. NPDC058122 TaxID=3346349 RepID=UPI0036EC02FD